MSEDDSSQQLNKVNLSSFAMYFDFDKKLFTELRTEQSDIFSKRYDTYMHFTALTGANIEVINKPIKEVSEEDCFSVSSVVAIVQSGQTLCIRTVEGFVVAAGATWQTSPTELEWVLFS